MHEKKVLRGAILVGTVFALTACGQIADLGGLEAGVDGSLDAGPAETGPADAVNEEGAGDGGAQDSGSTGTVMASGSCTDSSQCAPPGVCNLLPGPGDFQIDGGWFGWPGYCGAQCATDSDCPAWLSCQGGLCSPQCSPSGPECAPGQMCVETPSFTNNCATDPCHLGNYCWRGSTCLTYAFCEPCLSGGCPSCTANSQCLPGEVCSGGNCQACTTDSQCGPSATCSPTHTAAQCACVADTDCASNEGCSGGVCAYNGPPAETEVCSPACLTGQACLAGTCGPCVTFYDCNPLSSLGSPGLVCVAGVCTACTSNSQCGGGEACVGGTCGTCSTNDQCGPNAQCSFGFCICASDGQCAAGQRCGAGVCVEM